MTVIVVKTVTDVVVVVVVVVGLVVVVVLKLVVVVMEGLAVIVELTNVELADAEAEATAPLQLPSAVI